VYSLGVGLFALASAWGGLAPYPDQLIVARAVQGVGAALLMPNSLAIIGASFEEARRGKAIGTWISLIGVTLILGPVLGGYLVKNFSWREVSFINIPLAIAILVMTRSHAPESRSPEARRLNLLGAALAAVGLGSIVFALLESSRIGLADPLVLGSLVIGVAGLGAFLVVEGRTREPMMPLNLFRSRNVAEANAFTLLLYFALAEPKPSCPSTSSGYRATRPRPPVRR
jgi:MFS family permease